MLKLIKGLITPSLASSVCLKRTPSPNLPAGRQVEKGKDRKFWRSTLHSYFRNKRKKIVV